MSDILEMDNTGSGTITVVCTDGSRARIPTGHTAAIEQDQSGKFVRVIALSCSPTAPQVPTPCLDCHARWPSIRGKAIVGLLRDGKMHTALREGPDIAICDPSHPLTAPQVPRSSSDEAPT